MSALPLFLNKIAILKQIPIFQGLNWFELNRISRRAELVDFNKGDLIAFQGAPADAFYAVVSGRIYSYMLNHAGHKEEVDFILRGMHFGIISTLTGENHSRTYEAINDSIVIKINKDDFSHLLKVTPKLAVSLSQSLSKRIRSHVTHTKDTQESTIIAVYAPVQGSGSSTYAVNLALGLKDQTGKKVLLLSLSSGPCENCINLSDVATDYNSILSAITRGAMPIDLLVVKFDPLNTSLINKISQLVSAPVNDYNYVVLDLPNDMDEMVMKILTQSDVIHLIVNDREVDLDGARVVIDRLSQQLKERFHADRVQVIISGVPMENPLPHEEIKKILNYDILLFLPQLQSSEFSLKSVCPGFSYYEVDPNSEYTRTVRRLSRQISGVLVGLALGGGAALGMAHIGVIKVLEQEGIPIDVLVGSSMGALIASIWSVGYTASDLEKFGHEFSKTSGMLKLYDPVFPISGLVGGEGIRQWLKGKLGNKTFLHAKIPLRIVGYDLLKRKELVLDDGSLVEAVRKSVAIPGVIRPVMENGQMIIDGGVLNPLPTNVLIDMGVKKVIAVNVLQSPEEVLWGQNREIEEIKVKERIQFRKHPFHFVSFRIGRYMSRLFTPNIADIIVRTLQASEYVIAEQSAKQADVLIHPDLKGIHWFELYEVDQLIKRGEEAALKALPAIKELLKK